MVAADCRIHCRPHPCAGLPSCNRVAPTATEMPASTCAFGAMPFAIRHRENKCFHETEKIQPNNHTRGVVDCRSDFLAHKDSARDRPAPRALRRTKFFARLARYGNGGVGSGPVIEGLPARDKAVAAGCSTSKKPTGTSWEMTAMEWFIVREGKVHQRWGVRDSASIARQVGMH
jgi:hypothetical protein